MRDQDDGLSVLLPDSHQLDVHIIAGHGVERAEWLVEQQDRRIEHEGAADRDAPLHAAGELPGIMVGKGRQTGHLEQFERDVTIFLSRKAHHLDRHHDVFQNGPPIEQQCVLKHDADIDARLGHQFATDRDRPFADRQEARDETEKRAFAAAGGADDAEKLTLGYR